LPDLGAKDVRQLSSIAVARGWLLGQGLVHDLRQRERNVGDQGLQRDGLLSQVLQGQAGRVVSLERRLSR
jgi:hypothetical protein